MKISGAVRIVLWISFISVVLYIIYLQPGINIISKVPTLNETVGPKNYEIVKITDKGEYAEIVFDTLKKEYIIFGKTTSKYSEKGEFIGKMSKVKAEFPIFGCNGNCDYFTNWIINGDTTRIIIAEDGSGKIFPNDSSLFLKNYADQYSKADIVIYNYQPKVFSLLYLDKKWKKIPLDDLEKFYKYNAKDVQLIINKFPEKKSKRFSEIQFEASENASFISKRFIKYGEDKGSAALGAPSGIRDVGINIYTLKFPKESITFKSGGRIKFYSYSNSSAEKEVLFIKQKKGFLGEPLYDENSDGLFLIRRK